MKIKYIALAALAALTLNNAARAQNTIGINNLTTGNGTVRNDIYTDAAVGFGFYTPSGGATINELGYWDPNDTGLTLGHTVDLYEYSFDVNNDYDLLASVTVPAASPSLYADGYDWVSIPTLSLPDIGSGGNFYYLLTMPVASGNAPSGDDAWTANSDLTMTPSIGTVNADGYLGSANFGASVTPIGTDNNGDTVWGGANLGFEVVPEPSVYALLGGGMMTLMALRRKK